MKEELDIKYESAKSKLILFFKGFAMGFADVIPGVSGGTIALISGIYEHLIYSISSVNSKRVIAFLLFLFNRKEAYKKEFLEIPFVFLFILVAGIATGILSMSRIIPSLMEEYPFYTYSFFFGLVVFSISIPYKKMEHGIKEYALLTIFTVITFSIMGISPFKNYSIFLNFQNRIHNLSIDDSGKFYTKLKKQELDTAFIEIFKDKVSVFKIPIKEIETNQNLILNTEGETLSLQLQNHPLNSLEIKGIVSKKNFIEKETIRYIWIFFVASVAICAMVLPGISGAYILVLFGEYQNILKALHNRDIFIIGIFMIGVVVGLLSFVRLLKFLLNKYHSLTMASLTGFLVGSLNKIFPLKYTTDFSINQVIAGILVAFLGAFLLYFLETLSKKLGDPEPPI